MKKNEGELVQAILEMFDGLGDAAVARVLFRVTKARNMSAVIYTIEDIKDVATESGITTEELNNVALAVLVSEGWNSDLRLQASVAAEKVLRNLVKENLTK